MRGDRGPRVCRLLVAPTLPVGESAVIFGDGGAGKGFTAMTHALVAMNAATLACGLSAERRTPVLYLDWESTADDLDGRLYAVSRGLGLGTEGFHYRRMSRALADEGAEVRAEVSRIGAGLVIVDSLGPACGAEPEGADAAVRSLNELRALGPGVTRLVIAHMSKASADQRGVGRPFGSVYVQNLARSVWECRRDGDDTGDELTVALFHRKSNGSRLHTPLGLRFQFQDDAVDVRRADPGESANLIAGATTTQRIAAALRLGPKTNEQLAEECEARTDTVSRICRRMKPRTVRLPDGRWAFASERGE